MKDIKQEILEKIKYPYKGFPMVDMNGDDLHIISVLKLEKALEALLEANNAQWKKEANKIFDMYDSYLRELGLDKSDMVEGMKKRFNESNP